MSISLLLIGFCLTGCSTDDAIDFLEYESQHLSSTKNNKHKGQFSINADSISNEILIETKLDLLLTAIESESVDSVKGLFTETAKTKIDDIDGYISDLIKYYPKDYTGSYDVSEIYRNVSNNGSSNGRLHTVISYFTDDDQPYSLVFTYSESVVNGVDEKGIVSIYFNKGHNTYIQEPGLYFIDLRDAY